MKTNQKNLYAILQVITILAIYFLSSAFDNNYIMLIFPILFGLSSVYSIYDKLNYKMGRYANEIRFPTKNDAYKKTTAVILGLIIVISSILWIIFSDQLFYLAIIGITIGILSLANGLIDTPSGALKINKTVIKLNFDNQKMSIDEITTIDVQSKKITVYSDAKKTIKLDQLELSTEQCLSITSFLHKYLNQEKVDITHSISI